MMHRLINLLLFLTLSNIAFGQIYSFKNYTTANGLINNRTHTVNQDAQGYIWIGTDNGVCRYDGKKISYYTLPGVGNYYFSPCSRRYKQYAMFSTSSGVALFYGNTVKLFPEKTTQKLYPVESMAINDSVFLFADSRNGLFKIEKNKITRIETPILFSEKVYPLCIYRDADENIWLGCSNNTIFYKKGDLTKPLLLQDLNGVYINGIKEDKQRNIYFLTDHGIFKYKRTVISAPLTNMPEKLYTVNDNIISAMAFDMQGHPWVTTRYGAMKFDDDFKKYELINVDNGIASYNPWDAFCDRENNMWFATENGVSKLNNNQVINYKFPSNDFPNVKSGCIWDDTSFYYTNGVTLKRLSHNGPQNITGFTDVAGYPEERLLKMPDGRLWVNYSDPAVTAYPQFITKKYTVKGKSITEDKSGVNPMKYSYVNMESAYTDIDKNVWFNTIQGFILYKNNKLYKYIIKDKNGQETKVNAVCKDRFGDMWMATTAGIIRNRITTQADSFAITPYQYFDASNGINVQNYIKIICDSKNRIWTGGNDGVLLRIDIKENKQTALIKQYSVPEISSIRITDLLETDNGDIWVGTNYGIDIVSTNNKGDVTITKDAYGYELCGKNIYFLKKQKQKIYVGTTGCMAVINLSEKRLTAPPPLVFINEVKTGNTTNARFLASNNYNLMPDSNTLSFYFNSTSFINENIHYKYILEGVNKTWSQPTTDNYITYTQLRPGNYTFKVMAQNADGTWSLTPATKAFTIKSPFYNTWWFYTLCALSICIVAVSFYRYRVKQLKQLLLIRHNISTDLHDDIGSTLSSITMMSNIVKRKIETDPAESAKLASQIEDTSRQMIYTMSDIVWSIKPGNDTLEQLINRLRDYMHQMLENNVDDYALIAEGNFEGKNITMYQRRDLYLICKEIIHNTAKYAKPQTVIIKINMQHNSLTITAADDGTGFNFEHVKRGNGLQNIIERVKNNRGTYTCDTSPGKGTKWHIQIPL